MMTFPIYEKVNNVPTHKPAMVTMMKYWMTNPLWVIRMMKFPSEWTHKKSSKPPSRTMYDQLAIPHAPFMFFLASSFQCPSLYRYYTSSIVTINFTIFNIIDVSPFSIFVYRYSLDITHHLLHIAIDISPFSTSFNYHSIS